MRRLSAYSLSFDGVNDYVGVTPFTFPTTGALHFWYRPDAVTAGTILRVAGASSSKLFDVVMYGGQFYVGWYDSGNDDRVVVTNPSLIGQWIRGLVTWVNGGDTKLWLNSTLVGTSAVLNATWDTSTADEINFGVDNVGTHLIPYDGDLDDISLFDFVPTEAQARGLGDGSIDPLELAPVALWRFDDGAGTAAIDWSGNAQTGTVSGATWTKRVPRSLRINGLWPGAFQPNGRWPGAVVPFPTIPIIEDVTPGSFADADTGVIISGQYFRGLQGVGGGVQLSDSPIYGGPNRVDQVITAWSDNAVTITVDFSQALGHTFSPGDPCWIFLFDADNNVSNAIAVTLTGGGGGTLVDVPAATLVLSTFAPTVLTPRVVTPTVTNLTLATFAPAIKIGQVVTPATKALTLTEFAPTVLTPRVVAPPTRALTLTTFAPTVSTSVQPPITYEMDLLDCFTGGAVAISVHYTDSGHIPVQITGGSGNIVTNGSGKVYSTPGSEVGWYYFPWTPQNVDQQVTLKVTKLSGSPLVALGISLRTDVTTPTQSGVNGYLVQFVSAGGAGDGTLEIYKFTAGAFGSPLASSSSFTLADGDTISFRIRGSGTTVLTGYHNGSSVVTYNDSSSPFTNIGFPGLRLYMEGTPGTDGWMVDRIWGESTKVVDVIAEAISATNEVCWTSKDQATAYDVNRSTSWNGSYSVVGSAVSGPPWIDSSPSTPSYYTVTARDGGGQISDSTSEPITPSTEVDSGLGGGTIAVSSPTTRHNLLLETDGTKVYGAVPSNLVFKPVAGPLTIHPGPFSTMSKVDESFGSGLGALTLTVAGSGTAGATGGHLTYSGSNTTAVYQAAGVHYKAPCMSLGFELAGITGKVRIGYGADKDNGMFLEYQSGTPTAKIVYYASGTPTDIISAVSIASPDAVAIEICSIGFAIWQRSSGVWDIIANIQNGIYNLGAVGNSLATDVPTLVFTSSGTLTVDLTHVQATLFNGIGRGRQWSPIVNLDGSPYLADGKQWIAIDRTSAAYPGNFAVPFVTQIMGYDPATQTFDEPTCQITAKIASGEVYPTQDDKFVFDHNLNGFHCYLMDFETSTGTPANTVHPWYKFYSGNILQAGELHFDDAALVTLPSGVSPRFIYASAILYNNGYWWMLATISDLVSSSTTHEVILRGSAPDNFDTIISEDTGRTGEEIELLLLGSELHAIGGDYAATGQLDIWKWTNGTDLTFERTASYQTAATVGVVPQTPATLWYDDGAGHGIIQLLVTDDVYYQGVGFAFGRGYIYEATLVLDGWQFPQRTSYQSATVVVPTTLSLTLTTFEPSVLTPRVVTPPTKALTLTEFAPTVLTPRVVVPPTKALVLTTYAPTVGSANNKVVTPGTASLLVTEFAPTISITANKLVTPSTLNLMLNRFAPSVLTPRIVTPGVKNFTLTKFAPTVLIQDNNIVMSGIISLVIGAYAPTVSITGNRTVTPGPINLVLTGYPPNVVATGLVYPVIVSGTIHVNDSVSGSVSVTTMVSGSVESP